MTYFPVTKIGTADTSGADAFGRFRTSQPFTIFDSKQLFSSQSLVWASKTSSSASMIWSQTRASTTLSVTSLSGSKATRQTKQYFNYEPGKSFLILNTAIFGTGSIGVKKKVGYFDDSNGLFFMQSGSTFNVVERSSVAGGSPVDTIISQSAWNIDKFDGTGPSGFTLDVSKAQIFITDFEWLGVGRVRYGLNISGTTYFAHQISHANSASSVYMSSPNLPARFEISNEQAVSTNSLEAICTNIMSEGGYTPVGFIRAIDRGVTSLANVSSSFASAIISLRKSSKTATISPINFNILCDGTNNYYWKLVLNPTIINAADKASWVSLIESGVQYDVTRDITNGISGGILLDSGYANGKLDGAIDLDVKTSYVFGTDVDGNSDQIVLAVQLIGAGNANFYGHIAWHEYT